MKGKEISRKDFIDALLRAAFAIAVTMFILLFSIKGAGHLMSETPVTWIEFLALLLLSYHLASLMGSIGKLVYRMDRLRRADDDQEDPLES